MILTGSVNALVGAPGTSVYSASKAAVRSLARTLPAELTARGVRVNVISPGPASTPIYDRPGLSPEALEGVRAGMRAQAPLGRFGEPGEVSAAAAAFLASDGSSSVVGAELVADGGPSRL